MTDQPKWTPGPWSFDGSPMSRRTRYITRSDGRTIAAAHSLGWLGTNEATYAGRLESDANAHLIAAAPDLYAALEAIRDNEVVRAVCPSPLWGKMADAMMKARGET